MDISRRNKYSGKGRTISYTEQKINLNFDLSALNMMCSYVLSENRNIRRGHLINMRNLFDLLNLDTYKNDIEKMKRINFIKKGLEGKLISNLKNPEIVLKYINGGILDDDIIDIDNFTSISSEELAWINGTISESLKYTFMYNDIDRIMDICTRFKAADYTSKGNIVKEFENCIDEIKSKFRRSKVDSVSEMTFTLRPGAFEESIREIHSIVTNPARKLICGMQGLNELTGGGFESSRVYMLLGLTGVGKSLSLLNIAYQIKKYNKGFKAKDPTKIPVIVIMTMENDVTETVERLFNIAVTNEDMRGFTADEIIHRLRTEGELYLTDESPIDILIKYVPDKSVDTSYLYTMTEDLEDEGYEVICLIQDHIKKIRSCYPQTDIRLELGSIVNEFKTFATIKQIPVITNSHLNREGARTIDSGVQGNKSDLTRLLGRANVGESMLMLDNLDCGFIINVEYDAQGNKYMVFKRIKMRYKSSARDYICQPFVNGNDIKMIEDYYNPVPLFKDTLNTVSQMNNTVTPNIKPSSYNNIKVLDVDDDEENIFELATKYSSINSSMAEVIEKTMPVVAGRKYEEPQRIYISPITFTNGVA